MELQQIIKILAEGKAQAQLDAEEAKEDGEKNNYFYNLGLGVGYGTAARHLENLAIKLEGF